VTRGVQGPAITARTVVLAASVWTSELSAELVRLGFAPEAADQSAIATLQHIVARAGWPREALLVDRRPETSKATRVLMGPPTR
jgi:glycine/D-amino acid oxidase-like deaminating enzyme